MAWHEGSVFSQGDQVPITRSKGDREWVENKVAHSTLPQCFASIWNYYRIRNLLYVLMQSITL